MADKKISALTAATTPLAGTEVLPIVQSGATVKVANNDLRPKQIQSNATSGVLQVAGPAAAATRVMTTPDANFTVARTDAAQTFTGTQTFSGKVTAATFDTVSGTQSALNATATTIYTMPTLPNGLYIVQAALANNAPATFTAVSLVRQGNGTSAATALALATNMAITVSGLDIQATQTAGGTATISWSITRLA